MKNTLKRNQIIFWLLMTLQAFLTTAAILAIPADPKNAILLGYSLQRLGIIAISLVLLSASIWMIVSSWRQQKPAYHFFGWIDRHQKSLRLPLLILTIGLGLLLLVSPTQFSTMGAYFQRLLPMISWSFTFCFMTCLWIAWQHGTGPIPSPKKSRTRIFLIALMVAASVWLFIRLTGIGLTEDMLWNEGSVPLLGLQVWLAVAVGTFFWLSTEKARNIHDNAVGTTRMDIIIFIVIWLLSAVIWSQQPIIQSPLVTPPFPPNEEYYSYADGALYDAGGRYVQLGQGINNLKSTDKPVYIYFLGALQTIVGTDYERVVFLQTIVLATLPALIYAVGKQLHSRSAGVIAAMLMMLLEMNSYQVTREIQVSHAKMLLTELPTALLLVLLTWLVSRYQQQKDNNEKAYLYLSLMGSVCALAGFIRGNAYIVVPLLISFLFFSEKTWKTRIIRPLFVLIGFGLVALPWFLGAPDGLNAIPKLETISESRFGNGIDETEPEFIRVETPVPVEDGIQAPPPDTEKPILPQEQPAVPVLETTPPPATLSENRLFIIANQYLHNLVGASLVFPNQLPFVDIKTIVNSPVWDTGWNGELSIGATILMAINIAIAGLGLASSKEKQRGLRWFPLVLFLTYHLTNGIVRTSGSRYLVPVEWVVILYFSIGLAQLIEWGTHWWLNIPLAEQRAIPEPSLQKKQTYQPLVITWVVLLLFGLSMPLSDVLANDKLTYPSKSEAWDILYQQGLIEALQDQGFITDKIEDQVKNNEVVLIFHGMTMTPRFLRANQSIQPVYDLYQRRSISRLTFLGIGQVTAAINLPLEKSPMEFPDHTEFYVIGCADPQIAAWRISEPDNMQLPIQGMIVAYRGAEEWDFLVASTFNENNICP
ncbi:MAG: glycosyltransferase family 39 protein [Anaerolineae bacterium]|jgi:hypothetical protein|nr:glycosyltransferase family 39 protein [Anaerolineae bacterium]